MKQRHFATGLALLILATALAAPLQAQLNENCTVSVLNRSVQVQADGSWVLPNVPANAGMVRARATCVENGITRSGQSDYFLVPVNGLVEVAQIEFSTPRPIALNLTLTSPATTLGAVGVTAQITATAGYSDGTSANISRQSQGTNWFTSNANVVSVSPDGVITARASGTAIISAMNEGALGLLQISVIAAADSDNDGLPDTFEIANGLDPNNPADALTDLDNDGLSNVEEFRHGSGLRTPDSDGDGLLDGDEVNRGTNPTAKDTDGDGVSDGLEVQAGTNPLDPNSVSYAGILRSLTVTPSTVDIVINTVIGEGSRVVKVTGTLTDGTVVDLTARSRGTTYNSDNLGTASFGIVDGQIFGGTNGTANVTVANSGLSATVHVNVTSFAPTALGYVLIPGFANNVDVAGNYAYVAAGSTGLQVVDVSNHTAPHIVASLDTNGNANDVRIVGGFAYIADGTAGLKIIDISNPLAPHLTASLATGGDAWDVVVYSGRAYVAAGSAGLKIVDVANPAAPVLLGGLDTPGTAKGVDVSGNIAAVADNGATLFIDVTTPSTPALRGSAPTSEAHDVTVDGNYAYVADFQSSLRVIDFTNPQSPQIVATEDRSLGGLLNDVERAGSYLFGADVFFVHGVPISNIQTPASPIVRARLDIPFRDDNDTGIAVDSQYVYVTGSRDMTENGGSGDTALYIGQWLKATDNTNVPPSVQLTSPVNVPTVIEGSTLHLAATATDDVMVAAVDFLADGVVVATSTAAPYEFDYRIATGITSIRIQARARDLANNQAVTPEVTIAVIPDPGTTATGRVVYEDGSVVSGAAVTCFDQSRLTGADGTFAVPGVATIRGSITCSATFTATDGNIYNGASGSFAPNPGGTVNFGDVVVHGTVEISQIAKTLWGVPANFLARTLAAEGTKLVVAPYSASDRLVLLDTTDPAHPALVKNVQGGNNEIYDVTLRNGWAYVASYDFCTINLLGSASTPNCIGLGAGELAVALSGNYVFASRNGNGGWIRVYDVTNPGSPRYLREQSMGGGVDYTRVLPLGDAYLLAISNDGAHDMVVIDRRDVNSLAVAFTLDIPNFTAFRGVLRGNLLYLAGNQPEIVIVDVSTPSVPFVAGRQSYAIGQGRGIAASDAEAWIGTGTGQLAVMNVETPSAPSFTRSLNATGATWDTVVSGAYAYTANESGLAVMHISTSPVVEPSRITVALQGTLALVTGASRAVNGIPPLTVEIADVKSGASISGIAVAADGSFSATLPAASGDVITVKAVDPVGRTGGPIAVGSVPYGPGANATFITAAQTDGSFRARTLATEGDILAVTGWGEDQGQSDKVAIFDISNPAAPLFKRAVAGGNNVTYQMEIHNGWAFIASFDFCTLNLASATATKNCVGLGGGELAVAVIGNYALASRNGNGGWIRVYDVTNPAAPRYLREQSLVGGVDFYHIASLGSDYLVALGPYGGTSKNLWVINRRDVNSLSVVSSINIPNFTPFRGRVYGSTMYVSGFDGKAAIVDLSNPAAPVVKSVFTTNGIARGIDLAGSTAAVADGGAGVHFADVSNPSAPATLGLQPTGGNAWDALFAKGVLYVANEQGIVTVSSVTAPPQIDTNAITVAPVTSTSASITGAVRAVTGQSPLSVEVRNANTGATSGNIAVAANGTFTGTVSARAGDVLTIKATDGAGRITGPLPLGSAPFGSAATSIFIPTSQTGDGSFRARTLAVEGSILAVTGWGEDQGQSDKVVIYDISNPAAPVFKRSVAGGNNVTYQMEIHNGWAFIASFDFCTLNLASATSAKNCVGLGAGELAVSVIGNYALASRSGNGGWIRVYDVTNPAAPRYLREQSLVGGVDFYHVASLGSDYLVALGPYGGASKNLWVINRRDVNSLSVVSSINIPNFTPFRGRVYGSTMYVSGFDGRTAIVDLSNPAVPAVLSVTDNGGVSYGIDAAGTTMAVAGGTSGISFYDASNPGAPSRLGLQPVGGNAWDALFAGGVLYVANEQGIVVVKDVAAPPSVDESQITIAQQGSGSALVTGAARALGGNAPLTVSLKDTNTGTTISGLAVNGDGSFSGSIPAQQGDAISISVTDSAGRTAGPVPVGLVPFGSGVTSIFIPTSQTGDGSFRARTLASEGSILAVTGWGEDQGQSDKVVIYDISDPSAPVFKRSVAGGNNVTYQMEIHNGWAFIASFDFCTLNLASPTSTKNCIGLGAGELAVTVSGNYVFASRGGNGGWIRVYDVTNPAAPRYLREQSLFGGVDFYHVAQVGTDYLVALSPNGGASKNLYVIDRRDVNNLVLVSSINIPNFTPFRGRVRENLFYISGFDGKSAIVDLANPASPVVKSVFDPHGIARGIDVAGTTAVTADGTAGVHFNDVSNPSAPVTLGLQPTGGNAWDALFTGGVLYVANEQGIVVIKDVGAPPVVDPALTGVALASTGTALVSGQPHAIAGQAPLTATVRDSVTGASVTVNVASDGSFTSSLPASSGDPVTVQATDGAGRLSRAMPVGFVPFGATVSTILITPAQTDGSFRARTLASDGNTLVVAGYNDDQGQSDKVAIFDISNPAAPVLQRAVAGGNNVTYDVEVRDGWAYIASFDFCTLDVASPTATKNCVSLGAGELAVTVSGPYAFATRGGSGGWIRVYDVSSPGSPRYLREQSLIGGPDFHGLEQLGTDYLVASSQIGNHDVVVIDRRDVNNLVVVADLDIPNFSGFRGKIYGNLLYLSGAASKLAIVDLSNPGTPVVKSVLDTGGVTRGVAVAGNIVAAADGAAGIHFVNASNPSSPVVTGLQPAGGNAWDALFAGGALYIANEQGIVVVSDAGAPPSIDTRVIGSTAASATDASVTGSARSIMGRPPLSVTVTDSVTGAQSTNVPVAANGSFTTTFAARPGHSIMVQATDTDSRNAAIPAGIVSFGSGLTYFPILPAQTDGSFRGRTLAMEGNILAVAGWSEDQGQSDKIAIYDITNPNAPVFKRGVAAGNNVTYDMEIHNGWAATASYDFCTMNLADPLSAKNCVGLGAVDFAVAWSGNTVFTSRSGNGGWIRIYDVTNPATPSFVREQGLLGGVDFYGIQSYGNYLVCETAAGTHDVVVIDRSNINNLVKVADLDIPNFTAFRARLAGNLLYVAGNGAKTAIVDLTNPAAPVVKSVINTGGFTRGIAVSGTVAAVADGSTVSILNVANPSAPTLLGRQFVRGNTWGTLFTGTTLYIASELGLTVIPDVDTNQQ